MTHDRTASIGDSTIPGWPEYASEHEVGARVYKADTLDLTILQPTQEEAARLPDSGSDIMAVIESILGSVTEQADGSVRLVTRATADTIAQDESSTAVVGLLNPGAAVPIQHTGDAWRVAIDGEALEQFQTTREMTSRVGYEWMWLPRRSILWRALNLRCPEVLSNPLANETCQSSSTNVGTHRLIASYNLETPNPTRRISTSDTLDFVVVR